MNIKTLSAVAGTVILGASTPAAAADSRRNLRNNSEEGRSLGGVNPAKNVFKVKPGNDKKKGGKNPFNDGGGGGDGTVGPEIVGGIEVNPRRKYGFFVSIGGCGGSLIAPNLILSAAHCAGINPSAITLGTHQISVTSGNVDELDEPESIPVINSWPHPNYNSNTLDFDYWVLELAWSTEKYASEVVALDVPGSLDGLDLDDGSAHPLVVMGFGTLSSGGSTPNVMMEVEVPYLSTTAQGSCPNSAYGNGQITGNMLCAGEAGKDACQGDSGGPIVDVGTGLQVGIVSWGYGCAASNYPGIYSRVSAGYSWINQYITTYGATVARPPTTCWSEPSGWYDNDGPQYNCIWYGGGGCSQYGNSYANGGVVANQACCECGGGTTVPPVQSPTTASPTKSPSPPTNPPTDAPSKPPTNEPTRSPSEQCLTNKQGPCNSSTNCCSGAGNCQNNGRWAGTCK